MLYWVGQCLVDGWDIVLVMGGHGLAMDWISFLNNLLMDGTLCCNGWGIVLFGVGHCFGDGWAWSCNGMNFFLNSLLMGGTLCCNG